MEASSKIFNKDYNTTQIFTLFVNGPQVELQKSRLFGSESMKSIVLFTLWT